MSRYADQLPLITEPSAANFLIATDENDPKALVRIPAEGLGGGGGSTEYTIIEDDDLISFSIEITTGNWIYNGTTAANLDLSLNDGEAIGIINATSNLIYLYGIDGWIINGVAYTLIPDAAIRLNPGHIMACYMGEYLIVLASSPLLLGSGPGRPTVDPYIAEVITYLKFEGANGSTAIIDSVLNPLAYTAVKNARISTANKKFGLSSLYTQNDSDSYILASGLSIPFSSTFTVEGWYIFEPWNDARTIFALKPSNQPEWYCAAGYGELGVFGGGQSNFFTGYQPLSNVWVHVAVVVNARVVKIYVDGTQRGTTGAFNNNTWNLNYIKLGFDTTRRTASYIDNFRITKGVARYTQNFNPEIDSFW